MQEMIKYYWCQFDFFLLQIEQMEISHLVQIEWYQLQVNHYLMEANFLLFPTLCTEGRPFVVLDALAHGVEVIATQTDPLQELVSSESMVDINAFWDLNNNVILNLQDYTPAMSNNLKKIAHLFANKLQRDPTEI